jgi:V-type H+-transporting ATPase subunit H
MPALVPPLSPQVSSASRIKQGSLTNADVLGEQIPWPTYQAAGIISKEQLEMIYNIDKKPIAEQAKCIEARGVEYIKLITTLLDGISKEEVALYVLALLDELAAAKPQLLLFFHAAIFESKGECDPIVPLMKLLTRQSLYILEKATTLIAKVLSFTGYIPIAPDALAEQVLTEHMNQFSDSLMIVIKSINPSEGIEAPKVVYALAGLQQLVFSTPGRAAILAADGLPSLGGVMGGGSYSSHSAVQLLYQVSFCLWSLSYSEDAAKAMVASKLGVVAKLTDVVKSVQKEKVVRVALATLKNLLKVPSASADMVGAGFVKVLEHLEQRKWADEDIVSDIAVLAAALEVDLQGMSSWEVYAKEVASGKLEWTPSHKSDNFWKDNFRNFEVREFAVAKQLVALLSSEEALTKAIACHDIAEFIKIHPEGRRVMTQFGAKKPAMTLLKDTDPEVQKYALTAVQRLMVINWEFIAKS